MATKKPLNGANDNAQAHDTIPRDYFLRLVSVSIMLIIIRIMARITHTHFLELT